MFQSIRKSVVAVPQAVPVQPLVAGATVVSFGWLLANDLIHPLVVYLLQLYLSFQAPRPLPEPHSEIDMAESAVLREVTLTLPMVADMEIAASTTAAALAEFMQMSADKVDEVRMAVVEACINAFEHSEAPDRKVHIQFAVLGDDEPERLRIIIRDTGVGFSVEDLEEPRIEEKLKAASKRGWGLKIIQGLMDEVEIRSNTGGTAVVMSKLR